ncbi:MAG: GGDEF and EAL domain-containing protein [Roseburia sp.]|nr:GGDEF and EAL domain-containing protein [Roseburia sp.]
MNRIIKRVQSRLYEWRNMIGMVIWDAIIGIAFICMLYLALMNLHNYSAKIALLAGATAIVLFSIVIKYDLFYRERGRDDVTGGKNKREFERVASMLLRGEGEFVVVYANIDRFKLINDAYGDDVGDTVLRRIHKVIDDELLRWDEVSGRIMADNFGMLMRYHSMKMLEKRLSRINDQLAQIKDENGESFGVKMYFGVYSVTDKESPVSVMLEKANVALKKIAYSPQTLVHMGVYDDEERKHMVREKELEMKMEKALKNGEFVPFLQPKYELENETVGGAEALVRWIDPVEGMIFPNEFIPLFEKNGFIVELDLYMFEQVCKMVERWNKEGYRQIPVSVNMSRGHFAVPGFFDRYREILDKYDIPENSIEIELTESLFYNEMSMLKELINKIHEAGMLCSIDDFGSGYSSLNMLKDVRVDALKLDRVFFLETEDDQRGKSVIDSVLHLAQSLNLRTISEGVEVRSQVDYLKKMECDYIQGYVFAKPMPVGDFEHLTFTAAR